MNLMKRKHFGDLREAAHTANPSMILANVAAACLYGQGVEVMRYINDASRVAPYNSISTWGDDPAVSQMCDYINKVNMSRKPEDLGNLAYLIMSSDWCDEWLAFAIDVLGHIDVGTVNLGDALHWWCGHWRVLHQRILDAGWKCEPRYVWAFVAALVFGCLNKPLKSVAVNIHCDLTGDEMCDSWPQRPDDVHNGWDAFQSDHPFDQVSQNDWMIMVDDQAPTEEVTAAASETSLHDNRGIAPPAANAQEIRGHK